jgi:exodeoxyribonuclease VII small subunit
MNKKSEKTPGYAEAYDELQKILTDLEGGEIDVDELSAKVKRAAELIDFCRKRLKDTEVEVKRVVEQIDQEEEK